MRFRLLPVLAAIVAACQGGPGRAPDRSAAMDLHSFARPHQVRVTHLDLDLTLDFGRKVAFGHAGLTLDRSDLAAPLVLDSQDLTIEQVTDDAGMPLHWSLGAPDPILGRPLEVRLGDATSRVTVHYQTSPDAAALQWLAPEQTAGGRQPFLFSQGQAILTRSWIPLQDSPAVRITWNARIRPPAGLRPVMSAAETEGADSGGHRFRMPHPVPSYLIALACGDLDRREISPRCAVWAEPAVVDAAAAEFADLERMVASCEQLFGPYRWGRYDVLVLPPSFPFGGMENPCLTFATPTILAGDKSLVALIAHELAHSWSGNLVTNATWRDFWLNEGFTVYLEQRIMEAVYGRDRAEMEIVLGMRGLHEEMATLPAADQVLHIDLQGRNPDDGMTQVPYEKGAAFLRRLEAIWGRERFDAFLRGYFAGHAFRSITTQDFVAWLHRNLLDEDPAKARQTDVRAWIHDPGLPADAPVPQSRQLAEVERALQTWLQDRDTDALARAGTTWVTQQWLHFLGSLPPDLDATACASLDRGLRLTHSGNGEILAAWLVRAIRSGYPGADEVQEQFLLRVGRRKFLKPIYEALAASEAGKARARAIYRRARPRYHAVSTRTLDQILGWPW